MANNVESADFIHLRLTNATASSLDEKRIQSIIAGIDNHVSELSHYIAALRALSNKVKTDRAKEIKRRTSYARLISPLRSFPPEILGEIFLYASSGTIASQLVTSHVCQLWRHAALGCSELWSKIDGVLPNNKQLQEEYVGACIHRARSRLLTMIREEGSQHRFPADNGSAAIVDALKRCRWKELSWTNMDFACFNDATRALTMSPQHSNTLESLKLACIEDPFLPSNRNIEVNFDPVLMGFATFRRLKKLSISLADGVNFNTFNAPWKQLTHFSLSAIEADGAALLEIVRECTNVEELMLSLTTISTLTDIHHVGPPVHLSRLRKLHLTSGDQNLFTWITDICITPALDELVIDAGFTTFELFENQSLYDYLLENAQTLRRLWLSGIGEMGVEEMALIAQLELLEELALVANNSLDEMVFYRPTVPEYTWPPGISSNDANDMSDKEFTFADLRGLRIVCPITSRNQNRFLSLVNSRWWPDEEDSDSEMRPTPRLVYASLQQRTSKRRMDAMGELKTLAESGFSLNMLDPITNDLKPRFTVFDK